MNTLNADLLLHIGSFVNQRDAVALTHADKHLEAQDQLLRNHYEKHFGNINNEELNNKNPDKKIIARLLCSAEKQPDAAVNHNIYEVPTGFWDRCKWIVNVENSLDKEVQKIYNDTIYLLENTQATSIIQLKNKLQSFWHSDRQIKDYAQFKSDQQVRATSGLFNKILFWCLGFFLKLYYNPTVIATGENLESRSRRTCAKIGEFTLNDQPYDVEAYHVLADEETIDPIIAKLCRNNTERKFLSLYWGSTSIRICKKGRLPSSKTLSGHFLITRARQCEHSTDLSSERDCFHGTVNVVNSNQSLIIHKLVYKDSTNDVKGSDRELDQKLTQIMIEMTMQNKEIISLNIRSNRDDLPVLTAGGFKSSESKKIMKELFEFRSIEENKLFPPFKDYSSISTKYETNDFAKENVHYSKTSKSWSDIIQREPILKSESAVLPEYWAQKPKIIDR